MKNNRIQALRSLLEDQKVDAFFVTNPFDITYLTGFETLAPSEREAFVLVTQHNIYLFTDERYPNNSSISIEFRLLTSNNNLIKQLREIIKEAHIKTMGFEKEDLKWSEYEGIKKNIKVSLFPLDKIVIRLRTVKDEFEIKNITKACAIGDESLVELMPYLKIGKSEKEIAFIFETIVRNKGCEISFDPIVAIDKNSSIPHYNTKKGQGEIGTNSIILIDCGVKYNGYCSDITRMFFFGTISEIIKKKYYVLKQTQGQTIEKIKTGKKCSEIDLYCREQIVSKGLSAYPHSTGHGVGLEVHEYPKISSFSTDIIHENQVFTVEPGIYVLGEWGMRIEDTVYLDKKGNNVVLTHFSKEIISL